jgi:hypothetical protein
MTAPAYFDALTHRFDRRARLGRLPDRIGQGLEVIGGGLLAWP